MPIKIIRKKGKKPKDIGLLATEKGKMIAFRPSGNPRGAFIWKKPQGYWEIVLINEKSGYVKSHRRKRKSDALNLAKKWIKGKKIK